MNSHKIHELTKEGLLREKLIVRLLSLDSPIKKYVYEEELIKRAETLGVKEEFIELLERVTKEVAEINGQEPDIIPFHVDERGMPLKIYENLEILLKSLNVGLKYDELKREILATGIKHYKFADFITKINSESRKSRLNLSKDMLWDFTTCIAHENTYNPVVEYLESCYEKYMASESEQSFIEQVIDTISFEDNYSDKDMAFNRSVIKRWLVNGVKIAYNTGDYNNEYVIVLKGKQGIGKTRWTKSLMPKQKINAFLSEGIQLDVGKVDDIREITAYWLAELGEMGGTMKKSDRDALKAFITKSTDEFRTPYDRKAEKYPRKTFFIATVNDAEFLRDDTGNRRFVVLDVEKLNYNHNIDIDMMWGEVMAIYKHEPGYITYLTDEEQIINDERNREHMVKSNEQLLLEEYLPLNQPKEQWGYITSAGVANYIEERYFKNMKNIRGVGKALTNMGYKQESRRINGKLGRYYYMPFLEGYSMPI